MTNVCFYRKIIFYILISYSSVEVIYFLLKNLFLVNRVNIIRWGSNIFKLVTISANDLASRYIRAKILNFYGIKRRTMRFD